MENIKAKDELINQIKYEGFEYDIEAPVRPTNISEDLPSQVDEDFGMDQMTAAEYNEYLEAEAYASHIGQFIHKRGTLDRLRAELPNIKTLEFMEIETGKKTPLKVTIHHSSEQLLAVHEELAALHRGYEQRVNYFKAKVKNSVTSENARIQKQRADIQTRLNSENEKLRRQYTDACNKYSEERTKAAQEFEAKRQERIQEAANLKINVDNRFQSVIDTFLKQLS
jgi:DNA repair ATPase RecN